MRAPDIHCDGPRAVVTPFDDIVASASKELRPVFRDLIGGDIRELVVDLIHVQMVDSAGIGLLIAAHNSLSRVSGRLQVVNVSAELTDLFRSVRLHQHFSIETAEGVTP